MWNGLWVWLALLLSCVCLQLEDGNTLFDYDVGLNDIIQLLVRPVLTPVTNGAAVNGTRNHKGSVQNGTNDQNGSSDQNGTSDQNQNGTSVQNGTESDNEEECMDLVSEVSTINGWPLCENCHCPGGGRQGEWRCGQWGGTDGPI